GCEGRASCNCCEERMSRKGGRSSCGCFCKGRSSCGCFCEEISSREGGGRVATVARKYLLASRGGRVAVVFARKECLAKGVGRVVTVARKYLLAKGEVELRLFLRGNIF